MDAQFEFIEGVRKHEISNVTIEFTKACHLCDSESTIELNSISQGYSR